MPTLSAYVNVENTALVILKDKGYTIWCDESLGMYGCEKNGWDFLANSATELLGVIGIYEYHGEPENYKEYWWQINEPWLIDSIPLEKPVFKSVVDK
ncbi:hypothetical protein L9G74_18995 [Shewanella sp. C32]|uniref:Uncharacterized protein n=1 Tax=Shewanella electrica TaxID=515560 RepID=A0ABT2FRG3_9GAMM|nr:hypothetical protein [Shewanella electrica]MCH1926883.1 hypothetical protein [Shewanella electrica]MCS4558527.1 hypothetical protein [Shewanella electrica]